MVDVGLEQLQQHVGAEVVSEQHLKWIDVGQQSRTLLLRRICNAAHVIVGHLVGGDEALDSVSCHAAQLAPDALHLVHGKGGG